jgi:hypothetical protein
MPMYPRKPTEAPPGPARPTVAAFLTVAALLAPPSLRLKHDLSTLFRGSWRLGSSAVKHNEMRAAFVHVGSQRVVGFLVEWLFLRSSKV